MALASGEDAALAELLRSCRTIAVVGCKDDPDADAYRVPLYMQRHGYRIVPVSPKLARRGGKTLGEKSLASLSDVDEPIDMVNLFRAPENIPAHVDEILAMSPLPRAVWMQLGIVNNGSAAKLRAEGIEVVQDRCIMVEHRRLLPSA